MAVVAMNLQGKAGQWSVRQEELRSMGLRFWRSICPGCGCVCTARREPTSGLCAMTWERGLDAVGVWRSLSVPG